MVEMTFGKKAGDIRASHQMPRCGIATGSTVLTLAGALPVEYIAPGDRVITRAGARTVRSVQISVVKNCDVISISEGVLDRDRPDEDICVAPTQPIMIRDWRAKALSGVAQAVVAASKLVDGEYVRRVTASEIWMISLHFDATEVIYANGLELTCEPAEVMA
ncbi:Hint domain-containing protein [Thioclava sp. FR2]|uniref:Hint domain-containing protein n=1 Tax=Thioclava sp. FR2 TaxID=3445780 RepID=UPI003EBEC79B